MAKKPADSGPAPIRRVKGQNGTILMYEDRAVINHKGAMGLATQGIKGETTLFYRDISAIDYKRPGMTHGYIRFVVPGTIHANSKGGISWLQNPMRHDANAVLFLTRHNRKGVVEEMYTALMEKINSSKRQPAHGASTSDELIKLSGLLGQGAITQEEYDAAKKRILGL